MSSLWPPRYMGSGDAQEEPRSKSQEDMEDAAAVADIGPEHGDQPNPPQPLRPLLVRNASQPPPPAVPPPPNQPPPPPTGNAPPPPSDSLSLAQLRRIVAEFPKADPVAYDFTYEDMGPIEEEIDEWFVYQASQWVRLDAAQKAFELQWAQDFGAEKSWFQVDEQARTKFVADAIAGLSSNEIKDRLACLNILVYIILGRWTQTAGGGSTAAPKDEKARSASTEAQLAAMKDGACLVGRGGVAILWDALRKAFDPFWYIDCIDAANVRATLIQTQDRRRHSIADS